MAPAPTAPPANPAIGGTASMPRARVRIVTTDGFPPNRTLKLRPLSPNLQLILRKSPFAIRGEYRPSSRIVFRTDFRAVLPKSPCAPVAFDPNRCDLTAPEHARPRRAAVLGERVARRAAAKGFAELSMSIPQDRTTVVSSPGGEIGTRRTRYACVGIPYKQESCQFLSCLLIQRAGKFRAVAPAATVKPADKFVSRVFRSPPPLPGRAGVAPRTRPRG